MPQQILIASLVHNQWAKVSHRQGLGGEEGRGGGGGGRRRGRRRRRRRRRRWWERRKTIHKNNIRLRILTSIRDSRINKQGLRRGGGQ